MMLCPTCAAQVPTIIWKLVGAFVATPFVIVAVVCAAIRAADREPASARLASERATAHATRDAQATCDAHASDAAVEARAAGAPLA